ncbi:MAG: proline dehydrogenase family protein [Actinomycetota bacterium]
MSLLRAPVLSVLGSDLARSLVMGPLGRSVAARFVAGETLDEALGVAADLRSRGIGTILDHLGENVTSPTQEAAAVADYVEALRRIAHGDRRVAISVKLTQLGLDTSVERCLDAMETVLAASGPDAPAVMIDMEGSAYVDGTLRVFRELRARGRSVGLALQAYLHRTPVDVDALPEGSVVRLVKGAYLEPPEVAIADRSEVDRAFARLAATLLARGHTVHVATHDPALIRGAREFIASRDVPLERVEFQMLHGIRRDLQASLADEGLPVRIYVPYGTDWYPYFVRRLAERPANLWFFASNLVRRA